MRKEEIKEVMKEIIELLSFTKYTDIQKAWYEYKLNILNGNKEGTEEYDSLLKEISSIIKGVASFAKLPLEPTDDLPISKDELEGLKIQLAEELDKLIMEELSKK